MLPECIKSEEFTNWVLTSEALEWIAEFVKTNGIQKVVECGSGLSTILFGSLNLEKVITLEHSSDWYAYTRHRLQEKRLLEYVDLHLCQLQETLLNGTTFNWYNIDKVSPFASDLILVDGPPENSCLKARYPTPYLLKEFIKSGTWLLLDDYHRQQETEIVNLWLREIPSLELIQVLPFKYGLAVLRYNKSSWCLLKDTLGTIIDEQSNRAELNLDQEINFLENNKQRNFKKVFLTDNSLKKPPLNIQTHQQPLVSIIIPCYNAAKMIERCLISCFQQVYHNIEIIIVDNNSTDDSIVIARQLIKTTDKRVIVASCQHQGVNHARNYGFTLARGDYIQWLDADDELTPNKIALQVEALKQNQQFDIAYGSWEWLFYQNSQCQRQLLFYSQHLNDPLRYFLLHYWHPPHAYLLTRSAAQKLHEVQAWHTQRQVNTDMEYFSLAAILALRFLHVPETTVRYNHWSNTQISRSVAYEKRVQSWKQMGLHFQHYATEQLTPEQWFLLKLNWDFWKLAPTQLLPEGKRCFWLKHLSKNIGMTLTAAETKIVLAMNQLSGVDTLMGHTNQIIRFLWKQVVLQPEINQVGIGQALSQCVGLLADNQPVNLIEQPLLSLANQEAENLHSLISGVPLHAPLFTEQRFIILKLVDKLRVAGFLNQVIFQPVSKVAVAKNILLYTGYLKD
ncbi:glycosyltransferase family 2 protein [Nostoc sp. CHAB 5844]|nr:glycosyltransferase family 2 protein [Nostoc sp. CHAB 5844]